MLRDYVPKGQKLPGVRSLEGQTWPVGPTRPPAISSNNGRAYIDYRRDLLTRYAARWMCSLHDHDPPAYALMLFQLSADLTGEHTADIMDSKDSEAQIVGRVTIRMPCPIDFSTFQRQKKANADRQLGCLMKLGQASIIFSVFDDVFFRWLELITYDDRQVNSPTVPR